MNIKTLYNQTIKYNCSYCFVNQKNSEFLLVFLGSDNFIVTNYYYGCVAYGKRKYDYEKEIIFYNCEIANASAIYKSTLERLLKKYEYKILKCESPLMITIKESEQANK